MRVRKEVKLQRERDMSIVKVSKEVMFEKEKWVVAVRRPHKYDKFLIKEGGTFIMKIVQNVTLMRERIS